MLPYSAYLLGPPVLRNLPFSPPTAAQRLPGRRTRGLGNSSESRRLHLCSSWTSLQPLGQERCRDAVGPSSPSNHCTLRGPWGGKTITPEYSAEVAPFKGPASSQCPSGSGSSRRRRARRVAEQERASGVARRGARIGHLRSQRGRDCSASAHVWRESGGCRWRRRQ